MLIFLSSPLRWAQALASPTASRDTPSMRTISPKTCTGMTHIYGDKKSLPVVVTTNWSLSPNFYSAVEHFHTSVCAHTVSSALSFLAIGYCLSDQQTKSTGLNYECKFETNILQDLVEIQYTFLTKDPFSSCPPRWLRSFQLSLKFDLTLCLPGDNVFFRHLSSFPRLRLLWV